MRRRTIELGICLLAFLGLSRQASAGGTFYTPVQTQSTSPAGELVATNWIAGTAGINNPLVFSQFDPSLGKLTAIDITLTTTIRNDYELRFVQTPKITTIDVATSATSNPSILNNPAELAKLTDGPTVTLFGPDGTTQIFGAPGTRQPVDFVQMTEKTGVYSSLLPVTDPNYISPTLTTQSFSRSLTAADSLSLFSDFIGSGNVDLPVTATAFSSFFSSSGNGGGAVMTTATATVQLQYAYSIPEPSSVVLLGLGVVGALVASRRRRPSSRPS